MDKNKNAVEQLKKGIVSYVKEILKNAPMDKTCVGLVKEINEDNTYTVDINKIRYYHVPTIGGNCSINETVKVLIPQNQYSNMFILKGGQGDGGTTDYTLLNNKPSINGVTLVGDKTTQDLMFNWGDINSKPFETLDESSFRVNDLGVLSLAQEHNNVFITKEEYDKLPSSKETDNKIYFIRDIVKYNGVDEDGNLELMNNNEYAENAQLVYSASYSGFSQSANGIEFYKSYSGNGVMVKIWCDIDFSMINSITFSGSCRNDGAGVTSNLYVSFNDEPQYGDSSWTRICRVANGNFTYTIENPTKDSAYIYLYINHGNESSVNTIWCTLKSMKVNVKQ